MKVWHPDDQAVAAAVETWRAARAALEAHTLECQICPEVDPLAYNRCYAGHQLAVELLARRVDVQSADAQASGPGPARNGGR